ncbi:MAG: hypothetical protein Q8865_04885 [Bacillota bacterium]|nr:hypothetical protein [Bacillota bacterium]
MSLLKRGDFMKGAILQKGEIFYTRLSRVFSAINNAQENYNWLISYAECYPDSLEMQKLFENAYCWMSGESLSSMIEKEDFQWIWGALSGFKKDIPLSEILDNDLPDPEYDGYWANPVSTQHPLASIEIVPMDSSLVVVISDNDKIIENFRMAMPLSEDLETYNNSLPRNRE